MIEQFLFKKVRIKKCNSRWPARQSFAKQNLGGPASSATFHLFLYEKQMTPYQFCYLNFQESNTTQRVGDIYSREARARIAQPLWAKRFAKELSCKIGVWVF